MLLLKVNPTLSGCDGFEMSRSCYDSWDMSLRLFQHPQLFLECSVQGFV